MSPDKEQPRNASESVAIDVANTLNSPVNCGPLAEYVLESFSFFSTAYSANEPMAEHLLAGLCYNRDTDSLVFDTLKAISQAPTGWGGNETLNGAIMVRVADCRALVCFWSCSFLSNFSIHCCAGFENLGINSGRTSVKEGDLHAAMPRKNWAQC